MSRWICGFWAAAALAAATPAQAADVTTDPYPGVRHVVRTAGTPAVRAHVVVIDLTSAEIALHATTPDRRGQKPSAWAAAVGAQVAIGGDLFDPTGYRPAGLAMGDGTLWPGSADDDRAAMLMWDEQTRRARVVPAGDVVAAAPAGVTQVVSGRPMVLEAGSVPATFVCSDADAIPCVRAPRAAVGLDSAGTRLVLVVVDGWSATSAGMTAAEVGALLAGFGADDGFLLDGGGSAALFVQGEGGVVSRPSDGVERAVANHLGVVYGAQPPGALVGFIREGDIFDATKGISPATVRLDDGQTTMTLATPADQRGRYSFTGLRPRLWCVSVTAAGYHPASKCKQVVSNTTEFNSIAMVRDTVPIDAAVPDAARPDAAVRDGGSGGKDGGGGGDGGGSGGGDGGSSGGGEGGGCGCRVGQGPGAGTGAGTGTGTGFLVVCGVGLGWGMLRARRRGRVKP